MVLYKVIGMPYHVYEHVAYFPKILEQCYPAPRL